MAVWDIMPNAVQMGWSCFTAATSAWKCPCHPATIAPGVSLMCLLEKRCRPPEGTTVWPQSGLADVVPCQRPRTLLPAGLLPWCWPAPSSGSVWPDFQPISGLVLSPHLPHRDEDDWRWDILQLGILHLPCHVLSRRPQASLVSSHFGWFSRLSCLFLLLFSPSSTASRACPPNTSRTVCAQCVGSRSLWMSVKKASLRTRIGCLAITCILPGAPGLPLSPRAHSSQGGRGPSWPWACHPDLWEEESQEAHIWVMSSDREANPREWKRLPPLVFLIDGSHLCVSSVYSLARSEGSLSYTSCCKIGSVAREEHPLTGSLSAGIKCPWVAPLVFTTSLLGSRSGPCALHCAQSGPVRQSSLTPLYVWGSRAGGVLSACLRQYSW